MCVCICPVCVWINVYVYVYKYIHVYVFVYVYVHACTVLSIGICTYSICICTYMYCIRICFSMCIRIRIRLQICTHRCIRIRKCIPVCMYMTRNRCWNRNRSRNRIQIKRRNRNRLQIFRFRNPGGKITSVAHFPLKIRRVLHISLLKRGKCCTDVYILRWASAANIPFEIWQVWQVLHIYIYIFRDVASAAHIYLRCGKCCTYIFGNETSAAHISFEMW